MTLSADIAFLQCAADTAALAFAPGQPNTTFRSAETARLTVSYGTLRALSLEAEERRIAPRAYRLIDYPAVWLIEAAAQLTLHRADGNDAQAARYQKLGEHLRREIDADLAAARNSIGEV